MKTPSTNTANEQQKRRVWTAQARLLPEYQDTIRDLIRVFGAPEAMAVQPTDGEWEVWK